MCYSHRHTGPERTLSYVATPDPKKQKPPTAVKAPRVCCVSVKPLHNNTLPAQTAVSPARMGEEAPADSSSHISHATNHIPRVLTAPHEKKRVFFLPRDVILSKMPPFPDRVYTASYHFLVLFSLLGGCKGGAGFAGRALRHAAAVASAIRGG